MNKFVPNTEGCFNIPFDQYQAAPGVNKSLLDKFRVCPLLAYEHEHGLIKEEVTQAMLIGKLTDEIIFSPGYYRQSYYVQPLLYPVKGGTRKWNKNANYCRDWRKKHSDKVIITEYEEAEIMRMVEAVWADKFAAELLKDATFQPSLFARHAKTGLMLKGRPDGMKDGLLLDLKKVADASTDALSKAIDRYHWYVQAAFYLDLCEMLDIDASDFFFIAVEPGQRPKVNVRRLKLHAIDIGRWVYERDLQAYHECKQLGMWPGYSGKGDEPGEIDVPGYTEANVMGGTEPLELTIGGEKHAL